MTTTRTVSVEKYALPLHSSGEINETQAAEGWCAIVRAQGWTPVGEPTLVRDEAHGERFVIGRLVRAKVDGTINSDAMLITLP